MPSSDSVLIVSESTVFPDKKSSMSDLKLSVSDLPMLSCHYIQKGCLFANLINLDSDSIAASVKTGLSRTLSYFPPLAGRLVTDGEGRVFLSSTDAGAGFVHAAARELRVQDVLTESGSDSVRGFFAMDRAVSYSGHHRPILTVQVTELADGVFVGCSVNHAVVDGTSLWNFFNTFAEVCRFGSRKISNVPDFTRNSVLISPAVLKIPAGGPRVTFNDSEPLSERIFSFSREQIRKLKLTTNNMKCNSNQIDELAGKQSNDHLIFNNIISSNYHKSKSEISSFQSLSALLWRAITRARKLPAGKTTTFRMAVNCRHRLEPKLDPYYFGNAIQSIPTRATAGDVIGNDMRWCAEQLNRSVGDHGDATVRRFVGEWESDPRCFPLGNFDGAMVTMGSSPRFPMYDNDFGWGRPVAVRSGRANKFDGKISAFPGREGGGSVDLEVVLTPETMKAIEEDTEFMEYVSR